MKVRVNNSWVDTSTYIRDQGTWKYIDLPALNGELIVVISTNKENLNPSSLFGIYWTQNIKKRLIVNSGVTIGATNTTNYALTIPAGMGGILTIDNNGSIQGAGGSANSGTGGNAIFVGSPVSINNQGTIYAGGGGGGQGGNGGQGTSGLVWSLLETRYNLNTGSLNYGWNLYNTFYYTFWDNVIVYNSTSSPPPPSGTVGQVYTWGSLRSQTNVPFVQQFEVQRWGYTETITAGGIGGNGGIGRGYNQTSTNGIPGSSGGANAGIGGIGGNGGDWGASGTNGTIGTNGNYTVAPSLGQTGGPGFGGLAGFYVVNNGNVTWINTGTVAGRVA